MTQVEEKYVLNLRKHLPKKTPSFTFTFILSTLFILFFSYITSLDFMKAFLLFAVPYILITFIDYAIIRLSNIYFPINRISSLNILVFFFSLLLFILFRIIFPFFFSFFLAFSSLIYGRHLIYYVFLHNRKYLKYSMSLFYNILYLTISLIFFREYALPYAISTLIYWMAANLILKFSVSRFIKEFGENPLWFISSFINYLAKKDRDCEDVHDINGFFKKIYTKREVPVTLLGFHRKDGSLKTLFVFPYIHPGPFGNVGGSNLPNKLEKYTGLKNLMVFHTTTTHDDNIATEEDVKKIAKIVSEYKSKEKYSRMSDLKRFTVENIDIALQIFGKCPLIFLLPTGYVFDDVDFRTGMSIRRKLIAPWNEVIVVDAHNNFDEDALPLALSVHHINLIKKNLKDILVDKPIKMGYGSKTFEGRSIGPGGVKVAVFLYGEKKIAYILLDGNNIKRGLRDRIRERALKIVDDAEVFSTDNHIVNYDFLDLNPVGDKDNWDNIIANVEVALKEALRNVEVVYVDTYTKKVVLNMATRGQLHKITEITKMSVGRAKIVAPLSLLLSILFSILLFIYL